MEPLPLTPLLGQRGTLEWSMKISAQSVSRVWLFVTPWTVAHRTPLSMGFSRQEYWSGVPFPSPGDLPDPGIEPESLTSPALEAGSLLRSHLGRPSMKIRW